MNFRQWEIWKDKATGHWFVLISPPERLHGSGPKSGQFNGLMCFTLHGAPKSVDVVLDAADGFQRPTACQCDLFFPLLASNLHDKIGTVGEVRQSVIIRKIIEVFRMVPR
jgi:hypothetical protein